MKIALAFRRVWRRGLSPLKAALLVVALAVTTVVVVAPWFSTLSERALTEDRASYNAEWGEPYNCTVVTRGEYSIRRTVQLDCSGHPMPEGRIFEVVMLHEASLRNQVPVWHSSISGEFFVSGEVGQTGEAPPRHNGVSLGIAIPTVLLIAWLGLLAFIGGRLVRNYKRTRRTVASAGI